MVGHTVQESGNTLTGFYSNTSMMPNPPVAQTLYAAGHDAQGDFQVSQGRGGNTSGQESGNRITGSYTSTEGISDSYGMQESVSIGGTNRYDLVKMGGSSTSSTETGNHLQGTYSKSVTGTDSFNMSELVGSGPSAYSVILTNGQEAASWAETGNTVQQTFSKSPSGSGSYILHLMNTSLAPTINYSYALQDSGSWHAGGLSQTESGTDRFSGLPGFDNISSSANHVPGHLDFNPFGAPFYNPPTDEKQPRSFADRLKNLGRELLDQVGQTIDDSTIIGRGEKVGKGLEAIYEHFIEVATDVSAGDYEAAAKKTAAAQLGLLKAVALNEAPVVTGVRKVTEAVTGITIAPTDQAWDQLGAMIDPRPIIEARQQRPHSSFVTKRRDSPVTPALISIACFFPPYNAVLTRCILMHIVNFDDLLDEGNGIYTYEGRPFTGIAREFYSDGKVRCESQFIDGHQEGVSKEWYENGQLAFDGVYLGDGLHGLSREWHPNGQLREESLCEYGICIESTEWDENGVLIKEFHLQPTDLAYEFLMQKRAIWIQNA
jgi:hypothetical protein